MMSAADMESRNACSVAFSVAAPCAEKPGILATSAPADAHANAPALKSTISAATEETRGRSSRPGLSRLAGKLSSERRRSASCPCEMSSFQFCNGAFQRAYQNMNHAGRKRERRRQHDVIAAHTIHAALNRIGHH